MVLFSQQDSKIISISKEFNFKSTYNANKQRFIINDQGKEVDEKTVRGTVYQGWGKQEFKQISSIEGCPQNSHSRISQAALSQAKQGLDGGQELIQTNGSKNSPLSLVKKEISSTSTLSPYVSVAKAAVQTQNLTFTRQLLLPQGPAAQKCN